MALSALSRYKIKSGGYTPMQSALYGNTNIGNTLGYNQYNQVQNKPYFDANQYTSSVVGSNALGVKQPSIVESAMAQSATPVATAMNSLPQYNYTEGTAGSLANDIGTYNYLKDNGFTAEANNYLDAMQTPVLSEADKYNQTLKDIASMSKTPSWVSGLQGVASGVSALGGLYGMYQANKNYQLQKQQYANQMALARASEANRSAIAKSFGSNYTPAQF